MDRAGPRSGKGPGPVGSSAWEVTTTATRQTGIKVVNRQVYLEELGAVVAVVGETVSPSTPAFRPVISTQRFTEGLALEPNSAHGHFYLAETYMRQGRRVPARRHYEQAAESAKSRQLRGSQ